MLLIGLVARDDGLFEAGGAAVARVGSNGPLLLLACAGLLAIVTVTLNLDTSVTFITPVVLAAARRRGRDPEPFAYLAIFMSNTASLLLPGSNLTNLIVLQQTRLSAATFVARVAPAWAAAVIVVAVVIGVRYHRHLRGDRADLAAGAVGRWVGPGSLGVVAAVVAMVVLPADIAAVIVAGTGIAVVIVATGRSRLVARHAIDYLNLPLLTGLFAAAAGLGTLGRAWSGPAHLLGHLGTWATAGIGAGASVVVNNLPAASLLAARPLGHPVALLVGLNLGPNLAMTGSLAAVLWLGACRSAGWQPTVRRFSALGLVIAPATMAVAVTLVGSH